MSDVPEELADKAVFGEAMQAKRTPITQLLAIKHLGKLRLHCPLRLHIERIRELAMHEHHLAVQPAVRVEILLESPIDDHDSRQQHADSVSKRGYDKAWRKLREQVIKRYQGLCQSCLANNRTYPGNEMDHILSNAAGGQEELNNLQLLCKSCHQHKTAAERNTLQADDVGW